MEIYRYQKRLFMIMEVEDDFSFERKAALDRENSVVQKWEELMLKYQQLLPTALGSGKWQIMDCIFDFK